jgi:hypothetical protein
MRYAGDPVELRQPSIQGDTLVDGANRIPFSHIERVEARRFSPGKTLVLIGGLPLLCISLVFLSYSGYDHVAG